MTNKSPRLHQCVVPVCLILVAFASAARATVQARYVRLDAPASFVMEVSELEVYSGQTNVILHQKPKVWGHGYEGRPLPAYHDGWALFNGDTTERGLTSDGRDGDIKPWVEIDLGRTYPIDRIVIYQPNRHRWSDSGLRVVSLMNEDRRVIFAARYNVDDPINRDRRVSIDVLPKNAVTALLGQTVDENTEHWIKGLSPLVSISPEIPPADAAARLEAFKHRNDPAQIAALAKQFFSLVDLDRPGLKTIKAKYEAGDGQGALDAFRDYYFSHILNTLTDVHANSDGGSSYYDQADDLMKGNAIMPNSNGGIRTSHFTPGIINWTYIPQGDAKAAVKQAILVRHYAQINYFQRSLLDKYRATGNRDYLARWCEITDDWAMHFFEDASASPNNLRDYEMEPPTLFLFFCHDLAEVARQQPTFVQSFSSATFARMMMPMLEEYLSAYWQQVRHLTYNHTYGGLAAAYRCTALVGDFYAGQRFILEVKQALERTFTFAMTRDGPMIEANDDFGHACMPLAINNMIDSIRRHRPSWLPEHAARRIEYRYADFYDWPIRDLAPNGIDHRGVGLSGNTGWQFPRLWSLTQTTPSFIAAVWLTGPNYVSSDYLHNPDVRAIYDTVFGRGTEGRNTTPAEQDAKTQIAQFYRGGYEGPPGYTSDFMPYVGFLYFRRSWAHDASFLFATSQATGHYDANAGMHLPTGMNNTRYEYSDFGKRLLFTYAMTVDGQNQCPPMAGYHPGSKTELITSAPRDPIPARWLSSERYDMGECFFHGTYQSLNTPGVSDHVKYSGHRPGQPEPRGTVVPDMTVSREFIQIKPYRMFIVTNRVHGPNNHSTHRYQIPYVLFPEIKTPARSTEIVGDIHIDRDGRTVEVINPNSPGLRISHFSLAPIECRKGRNQIRQDHGTFDAQEMSVTWEARGDNALVSLLVPSRDASDRRVRSVHEVKNQPGVTGFDAAMIDSGEVQYRAANAGAAPMRIGNVRATGQAMLIVHTPKGISGIALGLTNMSIAGSPVALDTGDFQFDVDGSHLTRTVPILKPIEPVRFSPDCGVFVGSLAVSMQSATPGVIIRYTLDGRKPTESSPVYAGPITINSSTQILARAFRSRDSKVPPLATAPTQVSAISYAWFENEPYKSAASVSSLQVVPGLDYAYLEGSWFKLFTYADRMDATRNGTCARLMDVSMRKTDGPFGVRYTGYLRVPQTGVYTFYAPENYVKNIDAPGYDLRLWIDGKQWDLGQCWHGLGQWSIPLKADYHGMMVTFADARARDIDHQKSDLWGGYPTPWVVWRGTVPTIDLSGPGISRGPIPYAWFFTIDKKVKS